MEIPRKWKTASDDSDEENKTFDFDLAGASTPLKSIPNLRPQESSTIFLSPINKLHNLHLNTSPERGIQEEEEDEESDYNEAEQTIASDGSVEFKDDEDKEEEELISNPMYINSKKEEWTLHWI